MLMLVTSCYCQPVARFRSCRFLATPLIFLCHQGCTLSKPRLTILSICDSYLEAWQDTLLHTYTIVFEIAPDHLTESQTRRALPFIFLQLDRESLTWSRVNLNLSAGIYQNLMLLPISLGSRILAPGMTPRLTWPRSLCTSRETNMDSSGKTAIVTCDFVR